MKSNIILLFSVFSLLTSCANDSESDLAYQEVPLAITYANSIKSIMDNNCISCHGNTPSNGASISLTTYQNVKNAVLNEGLIDMISKAQGASGMMPYGGTRLPQSKIDEVITWKNDGYVQ